MLLQATHLPFFSPLYLPPSPVCTCFLFHSRFRLRSLSFTSLHALFFFLISLPFPPSYSFSSLYSFATSLSDAFISVLTFFHLTRPLFLSLNSPFPSLATTIIRTLDQPLKETYPWKQSESSIQNNKLLLSLRYPILSFGIHDIGTAGGSNQNASASREARCKRTTPFYHRVDPARGTETGRVPGAPEIRRATARTAARFRSDLRRLFARANNRPTRTRSSTKLSRARISRGISLIRGGIRLE